MAARRQRALFEADEVALPEGFRHQEDSLSRGEHDQLLARVSALEFGEIKMRGVVARRRIAQFGWRYSFESFKLTPGAEPPDYLVALQGRAEAFADAPAGSLSEILVTEYQPGATIGWHRDAPPFDIVVGVSLGASCRFRFRRGKAPEWETTELELLPRSTYLLDGPARREWQHSIPAVKELRYSITFRSLKKKQS
jgi:alkylated DNA repair dioxygenase AlkB